MSRPADWHLLFGLLALQNGLINRENLVASFAKWTSDKRKPIDQWLVDDGALTHDRREMLVLLVDLHVQKHGNDVARSLASLEGSSVPRARLELSQFNDPELAHSIAQLPKVEPAAFATVAPQQEGSSLSRFRILRPLEGGKGGMGEISIAEDQEVGRQVALKQIRTDCADSMSHRLKFQLEAEITGNLEHPGIVPIYSLGKDPSGRPFYAMRLVRGDNLNRAIDEFHHRGATKKPDYVSVEFLTLIDRLIDVAQAISYAHSRGVLHRDLKPGNILVGNFGETLVIDWGLARPPQAKQQSGQQVTEEVGQVNSEPFRVRSESSLAKTAQGSMMGTLGFAPPEQIQGNLALIGVASDVYSLGAILYQILTGVPPIPTAGRDLQDIMKDTVDGAIIPPRTLDSGISNGLEAICLKALSRQPAQRYSSATAFIDELQRWKADEPILARRETVFEKAGRFVRRHRAASWVSMVSLCVIAVIATLALAIVDRQRKIAVSSAKSELNAKQLAEALAVKEQQARQVAEKNKLQADWRLYAMQMRLAHDRWRNDRHADVLKEMATTEPSQRGWEYRYLQKLIADELVWEEPVGESCIAIAFHPDGTRLATGNIEGEVSVWDFASRKRIMANHDQTAAVNGVAFSPDGHSLLSAAFTSVSRLLDVSTGETRVELKGHTFNKLQSAEFSFDGKQAVTASRDKTARVWDVANGKLLMTLQGHQDEVKCAKFSPDGVLIATVSLDRTARLWEAKTGEQTAVLSHHENAINTIDFSPDGTTLATAGDDQTVNLWDVSTFRLVESFKNLGNPIRCIRFSPDGKQIAASGDSAAIQFIDLEKRMVTKVLRGHTKSVLNISYHPSGEFIASASRDGKLRVWNLRQEKNPRRMHIHAAQVFCAAFNRDGSAIATGAKDGVVKIHSVASGELLMSLGDGDLVERAAVNKVRWHQGTNQIVAAHQDGRIDVWDGNRGELKHVIEAHPQSVDDVAFIPGTDQLISCGAHSELRIWKLSTGKLLRAIPAIGAGVRCFDLFPDGTRLACGCFDGRVRILHLQSQKVEKEFSPDVEDTVSIAVSPDGKRIAAGDDDRVCVWDASSGEKVFDLEGHVRDVLSVRFTPDSTQVVSGGRDRSVRFWNLITGEETFLLDGQSDFVSEIAINADATVIASASFDQTLSLWFAAPKVEPASHK